MLKRNQLRQVVTIHYDIEDVDSRPVSFIIKKIYYRAFMLRTRGVVRPLIAPWQGFGAKFTRHWKIANGKVHVVHHGVGTNDGGGKDGETVARFGLAVGSALGVTNAISYKSTIRLLEAYGEWAVSRAGRVRQFMLAGIPEVGVVIAG